MQLDCYITDFEKAARISGEVGKMDKVFFYSKFTLHCSRCHLVRYPYQVRCHKIDAEQHGLVPHENDRILG